jgi:hypothetical protein
MAARIALQTMATQGRGPAVEHSSKHLGLRRGQAVGIEILGPESLEHLRQSGRHCACPVPGLMRLGQGREQIKGIRGGGRPPLCGDEMQIATGGGQVIMTEQFLECDQIDTCFQ